MANGVGGAASARVAVKSMEKSGQGHTPISIFDRTRHTDDYYEHLCRLEHQVITKEKPKMAEKVLHLVMSGVIATSVLMIALEIDYGPADDAPLDDKWFWIICELVFLVIFTIEIVVGVYFAHLEWFRDCWNWLDLALVVISIVQLLTTIFGVGDAAGDLTLLKLARVVRFARLVRIVKLVQGCKSMYIVIMAAWSALSGVIQVYCIMLGGLFFYATVATATIGQSEDLKYLDLGGRTVEDVFGTVQRSMYSLFSLMTLEGFDATTRPIVMAKPISFLYFASFVMIFSFGLLNMLVGLVVSRTIGETARLEHESTVSILIENVPTMRDIFTACDTTGKGVITLDDLETVMAEKPQVRELMEALGLPTVDNTDLFSIVDAKGNGRITLEEFVVGCFQLYDSPNSVASLASHAAVRCLRLEFSAFHQEFRKSTHRVRPACEAPEDLANEKSPKPDAEASDIPPQPVSSETSPVILAGSPEALDKFGPAARNRSREQEQAQAAAAVEEATKTKKQDGEAGISPKLSREGSKLSREVTMEEIRRHSLEIKVLAATISPRSAGSGNSAKAPPLQRVQQPLTKEGGRFPDETITDWEEWTAMPSARTSQASGANGNEDAVKACCEAMLKQCRGALKEIVDSSLNEFAEAKLRTTMQECLLEALNVREEITSNGKADKLNVMESQLAELKYFHDCSQQLPPGNWQTVSAIIEMQLDSRRGTPGGTPSVSPRDSAAATATNFGELSGERYGSAIAPSPRGPPDSLRKEGSLLATALQSMNDVEWNRE